MSSVAVAPIPDRRASSSTPTMSRLDVLSELKREMGPIAFSAQYQQSPIPPGGTIIKRKWLTTYDQDSPVSLVTASS